LNYFVGSSIFTPDEVIFVVSVVVVVAVEEVAVPCVEDEI
jgi:hypothetical protein